MNDLQPQNDEQDDAFDEYSDQGAEMADDVQRFNQGTDLDDGGASASGAEDNTATASSEHAIVTCSTSAGPLVMHFHKDWSPNGYERATSLFEKGYYDRSHFFRVVPRFLVQFGIGYDQPQEITEFADASIRDDPKRVDLMPFKEGYVSFAGSGPNSRTSQLFIAYDRAQSLGNSPWETPFGEVVEGTIDTVREFYSEYGDMPPWGKGPQQGPIRNRGSSYIETDFPKLDKFDTCQVKRVASLAVTMEVDHDLPHPKKQEVKSAEVKEQPLKKEARNVRVVDATAEKQEIPALLLMVLLAVVVLVILGVGFAKRRKRKVEKSV